MASRAPYRRSWFAALFLLAIAGVVSYSLLSVRLHRRQATLADLRRLGAALSAYSQQYGTAPDAADWKACLMRAGYALQQSFGKTADGHYPYWWLASQSSVEPTSIVLMEDPAYEGQEGACVLYASGAGEFLPMPRLADALRRQGLPGVPRSRPASAPAAADPTRP